MNLVRSVFKNTSSQILSRIISSGVGFFVTILIARYFGLQSYSDIAKVTALVSLFYLCVDLGANAIFLQLEEKNQNFQDLLSFRLLLAAGAFLFIIIAVVLLPYNASLTSGYSPFVKEGILLFAFSLFSRAIIFSTAAFFQKNFSYEYAAKASFAGSLVTLVLVGAVTALRLSVMWVLVALVFGGFAEASLSLLLARHQFLLRKPRIEFVKKMLKSSLPLTLLLFINLIYFRADMILLSLLQKSTAVGIYDFAYKFFDFLIALPLFLSNSLYPHLLSQEKNNRISTKNISLYVLLFLLAGTILVPFVWFASPLLIFVRKEFVPSVLPLRILVLSLPVFFATNILQWIFIAKNNRKFLVIIYSATLIINIGLNLLFIPQFSYNASAVITGLSELLIFLSMTAYMFLRKI